MKVSLPLPSQTRRFHRKAWVNMKLVDYLPKPKLISGLREITDLIWWSQPPIPFLLYDIAWKRKSYLFDWPQGLADGCFFYPEVCARRIGVVILFLIKHFWSLRFLLNLPEKAIPWQSCCLYKWIPVHYPKGLRFTFFRLPWSTTPGPDPIRHLMVDCSEWTLPMFDLIGSRIQT